MGVEEVHAFEVLHVPTNPGDTLVVSTGVRWRQALNGVRLDSAAADSELRDMYHVRIVPGVLVNASWESEFRERKLQ